MSSALEVRHVYKKFRRGEIYDSLRDLIPALAGRLFRTRRQDGLSQREFWALNDVSFEVGRGEAFGIIGDNGDPNGFLAKIFYGVPKLTYVRVGGP